MRVPVKLPGPVPTASASSVAGVGARLAQQRVDVLEQGRRARDPLAQHLAVADERARRAFSRRVERQDQHVPIRSTNAASAASRRIAPPLGVDVLEADGDADRRQAAPAASGHSTNAIASSK